MNEMEILLIILITPKKEKKLKGWVGEYNFFKYEWNQLWIR